jgi:hypothetical protein
MFRHGKIMMCREGEIIGKLGEKKAVEGSLRKCWIQRGLEATLSGRGKKLSAEGLTRRRLGGGLRVSRCPQSRGPSRQCRRPGPPTAGSRRGFMFRKELLPDWR